MADDFKVIKGTIGEIYKKAKANNNRLKADESTFESGDAIIFSGFGVLKYEKSRVNGGKFLRLHTDPNTERPLFGASGNQSANKFHNPLTLHSTLKSKKWMLLAEKLVIGEALGAELALDEEGQRFELAIKVTGEAEPRTVSLPKAGPEIAIIRSAILQVAAPDTIEEIELHYKDENNPDNSFNAGTLQLVIPDEETTLAIAEAHLVELLEQKKAILEDLRDTLGTIHDRHFPDEDNFNAWLLRHFRVQL